MTKSVFKKNGIEIYKKKNIKDNYDIIIYIYIYNII